MEPRGRTPEGGVIYDRHNRALAFIADATGYVPVVRAAQVRRECQALPDGLDGCGGPARIRRTTTRDAVQRRRNVATCQRARRQAPRPGGAAISGKRERAAAGRAIITT